MCDAQTRQTTTIIHANSCFSRAVSVLDPQPGDVVLDLCCAPGAKLCMISDMVCPASPPPAAQQAEDASAVGCDKYQNVSCAGEDCMQRAGDVGYVVGVDVSRQRLATCRSLLKR